MKKWLLWQIRSNQLTVTLIRLLFADRSKRIWCQKLKTFTFCQISKNIYFFSISENPKLPKSIREAAASPRRLQQHLHVNLLQTDKRINADILIFRRKPPKPQNMPNVWNTTHFHMEKSAVTITSYYWGTGWLETEFLVPVKILQYRID